MIEITPFVIAIGLLILSLLGVIVNPFFRLSQSKRESNEDKQSDELPQISVLLLVRSSAEQLERCLQTILQQEYKPQFEVVVVLEQGNVEAENVMKRYRDDNRIYTTFIPPRSQFMSKEKLAVTIGVKACHYEWVAMITSESIPKTTKWLLSMAQNCSTNRDFVLGCSNYEAETPSYYRFEQFRNGLYFMRIAQRRTAYRPVCNNAMFRKSVFINGDGYRDNLQFNHGEYDFLINKYAREDNTAVETSLESSLIVETPSKKERIMQHLVDIHLHKHLQRAWRYSLTRNLDLAFMYVGYIVPLLILAYAIITCDIVLSILSGVCWLFIISFRTFLFSRAAKRFDVPLSTFMLPLYEFSIGFHNIINWIRYLKSDKTEYTTHRI